MRNGDFTAQGLPTIYDPSTTTIVNGQPTRQAFPNNIIPSADFDPVAAKIQPYLPLPNLPGLANNYYFASRNPITATYWSGKIDYNITSSNRLEISVRYSANIHPIFRTAPTAPIGSSRLEGRPLATQISDAWTLSPSMVNEAHISFTRTTNAAIDADFNKGYASKIRLKNLTQDAFPNIYVGGALSTNITTGLNAWLAQIAFVPSDTLTLD